VTPSCGSDAARSLRPESCCSHAASAPAAIRTSAFAGSPPGTAFTSTPWIRHRAAVSPPTRRLWSARSAGTRWATTSSTSGSHAIRNARSAKPAARSAPSWVARHAVRRALEAPQRLLRQRREVDLLAMLALMVTYGVGQAARRSLNLVGSAATACTICSCPSRMPR
jgi:hypothetical protein